MTDVEPHHEQTNNMTCAPAKTEISLDTYCVVYGILCLFCALHSIQTGYPCIHDIGRLSLETVFVSMARILTL